jgi:formylglycine-generating enzyme required for sulfatase activity
LAPGLTSVQFVTVGNPGNAPDTRYNGISVGVVDHVYQIGKFEITAGQYTEFLNAVAKEDPNGLYSTEIPPEGSSAPNIVRSGSSPTFSYSVAADWANRPVNYVSFWDAGRFANWLQNGQPTGAQAPGTTEDGAYHDIGNQALFGRNPGARYFIPTEDEWYKAAFHDKSSGQAASYFDYPTGSDTAPINTLPDTGNHANIFDFYGTGNNDVTIGSPYYRTNVGDFVNSPSPYGTFDQGGNVWEWKETAVDIATRGVRGGSFDFDSDGLRAAYRYNINPSFEGHSVGFRIASIPEPGSLMLCVLGAATMILWLRITR